MEEEGKTKPRVINILQHRSSTTVFSHPRHCGASRLQSPPNSKPILGILAIGHCKVTHLGVGTTHVKQEDSLRMVI